MSTPNNNINLGSAMGEVASILMRLFGKTVDMETRFRELLPDIVKSTGMAALAGAMASKMASMGEALTGAAGGLAQGGSAVKMGKEIGGMKKVSTQMKVNEDKIKFCDEKIDGIKTRNVGNISDEDNDNLRAFENDKKDAQAERAKFKDRKKEHESQIQVHHNKGQSISALTKGLGDYYKSAQEFEARTKQSHEKLLDNSSNRMEGTARGVKESGDAVGQAYRDHGRWAEHVRA